MLTYHLSNVLGTIKELFSLLISSVGNQIMKLTSMEQVLCRTLPCVSKLLQGCVAQFAWAFPLERKGVHIYWIVPSVPGVGQPWAMNHDKKVRTLICTSFFGCFRRVWASIATFGPAQGKKIIKQIACNRRTTCEYLSPSDWA